MANETVLYDLGAVDVLLKGADIGSIALRGWGPNPISIRCESPDPNLYNEDVGAFGDMLINKNYKAKNKMLELNILRGHYYYKKMKDIVARELSGGSVLFSVLVKNNNDKELITCAQAVLKNDPGMQFGPQPEGDSLFRILMPACVYGPPTIA